MNEELLMLWITASLREHLDRAALGFPVRWSAQTDEPNTKVDDEAFLDLMFEFPRRGSAHEEYAIVTVRGVVKSIPDDDDVYHHVRMKARLTGVLGKTCRVFKYGGPSSDPQFDESQVGILRRVPTETLTIMTGSSDTPDASVVTVVYEFLPC